jgi:hypothetical protein
MTVEQKDKLGKTIESVLEHFLKFEKSDFEAIIHEQQPTDLTPIFEELYHSLTGAQQTLESLEVHRESIESNTAILVEEQKEVTVFSEKPSRDFSSYPLAS